MLFESIPEALLLIHDNGLIQAANARACELLGRSRAELVQQCITTWLLPVTGPNTALPVDPTGSPCEGEVYLQRDQGQPLRVTFRLTPRLQDDQHLLMLSVSRDKSDVANDTLQSGVDASASWLVQPCPYQWPSPLNEPMTLTEFAPGPTCSLIHQQAVHALNARQYHNILNTQVDLICRFTPEGILTFVNQAYCQVFGHTVEELLGQSLLELVPPSDRAIVHQQLQELQRLTPEHPHLTQEHLVTLKTGAVRWQQWANQALFDDQQQLLGFQAVGRDITEQKQAELALQQSEQQFRSVLERLSLAAIMIDLEGRVHFCNDFILTLTGWQREDLMGQICFDRLLPDEIREHVRRKVLETLGTDEFPTYYENPIVTRAGDRRLMAWNNAVLRDAAGTITGVTSIGVDITDQRDYETSIYEISQRLALATDAVEAGIWDWDLQADELIWDDRLYDLYQVKPDEFDGAYTAWRSRLHPEDLEAAHAAVQASLQNCQDLHTEFRIIWPDGQIRYIEAHAKFLQDDAQRPLRMIGVNRDITHRKANEVAIQETTQRLALATTAAHLGIWDWNLEQQTLLWDDRLYELYGVDPDTFEVSYENWLKCLHPDDIDQIHGLNVTAIAHQNAFHSEFRIVLPDGQIRYIEDHAIIIRNAAGEPCRIIGANWDITARKLAALELSTTNQQLQALLDNSPAVIALFDETGQYQRVNPITAALLGRAPDEIVGQRFADLFSPAIAEAFMERVQAILATQQPQIVEDCLPLLGQDRIFRSVLFPVMAAPNQPRLLGSIATDITPLIESQVALQRQVDQERLHRLIAQHIRSSLDLDDILNTTATEVRHFLKTDRVLVYRFNGNGSGDMIVESVGPDWITVLGTTLRDPCFIGDLVEKYRQGHIGQIPDIQSEAIAPCYRELLEQFQVQASLTIPLVIDNHLWGLLCIHHCTAPRQWQEAEISFIQSIADQVEIAIQQAQLLTQTAVQAQREQLLNEIVAAIRGSLDFQTIMKRAGEKLLIAFQVNRCIVALCSENDEFLEYTVAVATPDTPTLQGQRIPLAGNPHAVSILAADQAVPTDDVYTDPLLVDHLPLAQRLGIGAMLNVAIRYKEQVKGLLSLHYPVPRVWTADEQLLLTQVADQLAIALQQSELYQQAQAELAERTRLEAQLRHQVMHDSLTGLPNRTFLLTQVEAALQRLRNRPIANGEGQLAAPEEHFAVLFLDLDRFKIVNDSLGHNVGDRLLQLVAQRLQSCLEEYGIATRLGGDEFVILLPQFTDTYLVFEMARRIHTALEIPILMGDREIFLRASIGIALGARHYTDPKQVLRDADIAMYEAKASRQPYVLFDASMHTIALQKMHLENDLRQAIKAEQFVVHYQPIICLQTGAVAGFEALVRWQHPTRGLLYPDAFLPIAEETGLITAIDLWVMATACRQRRRWQAQFPHLPNFTINVNLSGQHFSSTGLVANIDQILAETHLPGHYLKLEITESALITNAALAVATLSQLRERQISTCMDDFGTGYSSLSYLHRFPIDMLKIDKSFILTLHTPNADKRDHEIVNAIIHLALNLNLQVIAEGVSHESLAGQLQRNGCQFGQGFFFARPLSAQQINHYLRSHS